VKGSALNNYPPMKELALKERLALGGQNNLAEEPYEYCPSSDLPFPVPAWPSLLIYNFLSFADKRLRKKS
jgi:hypothetical protein